MGLARYGSSGCVLSEHGRFAVFGVSTSTTACEVLNLDGDERWEALMPMKEARYGFACAVVGGCVIVAGCNVSGSVDVCKEALGRWRRLPHGAGVFCNLPHDAGIVWMSSAMMR